MMPLLAAVDFWPFAVLIISVVLIIILITVVRMHAFLALILAAFAAGMLARSLPQVPGEPSRSHWLQAVELSTREFGLVAGRIGVVIALASVIGMCLMESGAADKVVRRFLAVFGEKRAGAAILISGYIISIPIFFDTFFMLLLPLARAMTLRTGKDYLLYIMAICCGGTVTHSLVAPHPGPLAMAETLKLDLGLTIMVGIVVGTVPTAVSWFVSRFLNRRVQIPVRETSGASAADLRAVIDKPESQLPSFAVAITPVVLPILLISFASTLIAIQTKGFDSGDITNPTALIARLRTGTDPVSQYLRANLSETNRFRFEQFDAASPKAALVEELNKAIRANPSWYAAEKFQGVQLRPQTAALARETLQGDNLVRFHRGLIEDAYPDALRPTTGLNPTFFKCGEFIGNRNIALLIGTIIAVLILMRQRRFNLAKIGELIGPPFETAGVIILITSAGGAFGLMLKNAGVGEAIKAAVAGKDINLILLSWTVAAVIRIAQGSATVAMLTTAAMVYPIMSGGGVLPYHPIYIFLAIGFGAMMLSWMNDSGFWVVGKLSGFTEKETLKTWSVVLSVNSLAGLIITLLLSKLVPFGGP
jgi:gluconate:H+ symporter, GntP family